MNTLIIGRAGTGNWDVAEALKDMAARRLDDVTYCDDSTDVKAAEAQLAATKGKTKLHTIMVIQDFKQLKVDPHLIDYLIQTDRMDSILTISSLRANILT